MQIMIKRNGESVQQVNVKECWTRKKID